MALGGQDQRQRSESTGATDRPGPDGDGPPMRRRRYGRSMMAFVVPMVAGVGVILAATFAVLVFSILNARDDSERATQAVESLSLSLRAERSVVDLETGLRGYLLTGQARFLAPYERARTVLPSTMARLEQLADTPSEQRQVRGIAASVDRYVERYAVPLLNAGAPLPPKQAALQTARGKRMFDLLRDQINTFNSGEQAKVASASHQMTVSSNRSVAIAVIGGFGSVLLLAGLTLFLVKKVVRPVRTVAYAASDLSEGDLTTRVPRGRGEIGLLARCFNSMARALQARDEEISEANQRLEATASAAEEASQMKSNFLANMSHEIRTPLNGVIGMLTLLEETPLESEQREYVTAAQISGEALLAVIGDILDFSKIEAGHLELDEYDFDLHETVETTCEIAATGAYEKGIELNVFIEGDVPRGVRGDRARLVQVLTNLLSNAIKFTPAGEVVVDVRVAEQREDDTMVHFTVRDTGIGIEPGILDRLFHSFTQADPSTTRRFGGTGLGLAISRELTMLMGGTIEAESEIGKGSSFRFTAPFEPPHGDLRAPSQPVELRGLKVLIVDDNATNRRIVEAYTAAWGMRATGAHDASEALDRMQEAAADGEPFDVALLDFQMPGMDGAELADRIRSTPALRSTRLIMLSSSRQESARMRAVGLDANLTKPIAKSRLLQTIETVIGARPGRPVPAKASNRARKEIPKGPTGHILVAEDQPVNRMFIEEILAIRGHTLRTAGTGREVLEMLEQDHYDAVLMDCQMPELDGYEATREIRRREAASGERHVPIIAMTAHALDGDRERCLEAGMDDYLPKPLRVEDLDKSLAHWLTRGDAPDPGPPADDPPPQE